MHSFLPAVIAVKVFSPLLRTADDYEARNDYFSEQRVDSKASLTEKDHLVASEVTLMNGGSLSGGLQGGTAVFHKVI